MMIGRRNLINFTFLHWTKWTRLSTLGKSWDERVLFMEVSWRLLNKNN